MIDPRQNGFDCQFGDLVLNDKERRPLASGTVDPRIGAILVLHDPLSVSFVGGWLPTWKEEKENIRHLVLQVANNRVLDKGTKHYKEMSAGECLLLPSPSAVES